MKFPDNARRLLLSVDELGGVEVWREASWLRRKARKTNPRRLGVMLRSRSLMLVAVIPEDDDVIESDCGEVCVI